MTNQLPSYTLGFACGFLSAIFAMAIELILRLRSRKPADVPPPAVQPDLSPTEPEPVEFSTRMSNEEWADAMIAELRRKIESDTGRKE